MTDHQQFKDFLSRELPLVSKADPRVLTDLLLVHLENLEQDGVESTMEAVNRDLYDFITSARDRELFGDKIHAKLIDIKRETNARASSGNLHSSSSSSSSTSFRNNESSRMDSNLGRQSRSRSRSRERVIKRTNDASSSSIYHERQQDYGPPSSSSFTSTSFAPPQATLQHQQQGIPVQFHQQQQQFGAAPSQSWQLPPNTWQLPPNFQSPAPPLFGGVGIGGPATEQSTAFQRPPAQQQNQGQPRAQRTLCAQNCHGAATDKNALLSYFSSFGTVLDVHITGAPPKQTAFVLFSDSAACDQAVASRGLVCGESNVRLMYANYEAKVPSTNIASSSAIGGVGGGGVDSSNKERLLQQQQQQQHQLAMQMQRQQEKADRERAAMDAVERATAAAAAEAAKRETSVDKAHRVIQAKAKEADDLQLAITAQKEMMIKFKEQKSTMSAEEQAATLAAIRAQAAKIKEQQGKLNAAVTTAKMAVDNTKKDKKGSTNSGNLKKHDQSNVVFGGGEGTSAGGVGGGRVTVSHGSSTTTSQKATANSGVSHDKDQKADDDDRDAGGRRNEDDNRNVVDEEEETSFVIED